VQVSAFAILAFGMCLLLFAFTLIGEKLNRRCAVDLWAMTEAASSCCAFTSGTASNLDEEHILGASDELGAAIGRMMA
jgi:hypothetical protein